MALLSRALGTPARGAWEWAFPCRSYLGSPWAGPGGASGLVWLSGRLHRGPIYLPLHPQGQNRVGVLLLLVGK